MTSQAISDSSTDTDFYLEASTRYPLLGAEQEKAIDLRKWASARRCTRHLLGDARGRALLRDFCRACQEKPPQVDNFEPRSLYFTLRKDIIDYLPGGGGARQMQELARALGTGLLSIDEELALISTLHWPTTLQAGLAVIFLRQRGAIVPDLVADAMGLWQPAWSRVHQPADPSQAIGKAVRSALRRYGCARDKLVMHNLRLVHKLAWDQPARGVSHRDLVQEGIVGLIRAAEKYDFRRGFRFTTYAYSWINQHLQRATENRGSLINYPAHVVREINQLHRTRMTLQEKTGHDPGVQLLAEQTGFDLAKVNQLRKLGNITVSIDHGDAEENDLRIAANIADPDSGRALEELEHGSVRRLLWQHMDQLEERERQVLCGRWGLDGRPQRTFAQLADQLGVSREWVRQLEKSAMKKLGQQELLGQAFEELEAC